MDELYELEEEAVDHIPVSRDKKEKILLVLDLVVNVIIIVALVILVRKFLISPFQVFGPSMCNTLNSIEGTCHRGFGEYLIVNKAIYQDFFGWRFSNPERGDIIVFRPPHNEKDFYIKRVIGTPGDIVKIKSGKVYVKAAGSKKEEELKEPYTHEQVSTFLYQNPTDTFTVPEGKYFLLGDNRKESTDSRTCFGPSGFACRDPEDFFLPVERIQGKAWVILWPFNNLRLLKNPDYGF